MIGNLLWPFGWARKQKQRATHAHVLSPPTWNLHGFLQANIVSTPKPDFIFEWYLKLATYCGMNIFIEWIESYPSSMTQNTVKATEHHLCVTETSMVTVTDGWRRLACIPSIPRRKYNIMSLFSTQTAVQMWARVIYYSLSAPSVDVDRTPREPPVAAHCIARGRKRIWRLL